MSQPIPSNTTHLLVRFSQGDSDAASELLPRVYDELRNIAAAHLRRERADHTLQPTALVNELYMRLAAGAPVDWQSRAHFLAVAAKAMRHILVNHTNARNAEKRGGGRSFVALEIEPSDSKAREFDLLALDDVLNKLAGLDPRKAQIVEQRFFGGMTVEEIAQVQKVSVSTVEADWRFAKAWLSTQLSEA